MPKDEKKGFRYKKRPAANMKERANQKAGNYDSIFKPKFKLYKAREGKNHIRILPPTWDDAAHYGFEIFVNYNIGADKQSYLSLYKMLDDKNDPLYLAAEEARKDGDQKLADSLKTNKRVVMWVIDRFEEDEGPQLWSAPWTVDRDIANLASDDDDGGVINLDDPEEGNDVRFFKEGTGRKTEYNPSKMKILKSGPISDDEELQEQWLEFIADNPIPDTLNYYDAEHIESVFGGRAGRDDDDDDDEVKSSKKRRRDDDDDDERPSSKKRRRDDDDDDERPAKRRASRDDDDDEPPRKKRASRDDDDDEPPRKKRASRDDDDDDEDKKPAKKRQRDDDDEDEKPAKKRSRDDDDDDRPSKKRNRDDDEDDDRPAKKKRSRDDDDEAEDEDEKPAKKGSERMSVSERLAARKKRDADD